MWSSLARVKSDVLDMPVTREIPRLDLCHEGTPKAKKAAPDSLGSCYIPVNTVSVIFFSPSPRRKSSKLYQR